MKKKLVSIVFSCLLVGNLLSGCGKTGSSDSSSKPENGEKVKIEFFNQKSEIKEIMDEIVEEFNSTHPNIEVEQVQVPDGGNVLMQGCPSGDMPDIAGISK